MTNRGFIYALLGLGCCFGVAHGHAATLGSISEEYLYERWENGELVERRTSSTQAPIADLSSPEAAATPAFLKPAVQSVVSIQDCEIESGCISGGLMTILITGEITPGPDSDNGDPISFCAVWTGQVGAAADEGAAAEAATGGGSAEMQVSTLPILASATVEDAAYIEIVGGTKYSFGPLTASAPPNASSSDQMTAQIDAVIGDTLVISLSSAAAVATPFEGSASGSTLIELNFNVGPCGQPTSVPTTPWSGIVVLLAGLLALGGVLLRRRSSDTGR